MCLQQFTVPGSGHGPSICGELYQLAISKMDISYSKDPSESTFLMQDKMFEMNNVMTI